MPENTTPHFSVSDSEAKAAVAEKAPPQVHSGEDTARSLAASPNNKAISMGAQNSKSLSNGEMDVEPAENKQSMTPEFEGESETNGAGKPATKSSEASKQVTESQLLCTESDNDFKSSEIDDFGGLLNPTRLYLASSPDTSAAAASTCKNHATENSTSALDSSKTAISAKETDNSNTEGAQDSVLSTLGSQNEKLPAVPSVLTDCASHPGNLKLPPKIQKGKCDLEFQPAQVLDSFYLNDDGILVEDSSLVNRATSTWLSARTPRPYSSNSYTVPCRSIGGLQDQFFEGKFSCSCKKVHEKSRSKRNAKRYDTCLKLYCDCFGSGSYCNEGCSCSSTCANKASEKNHNDRTEAIVAALTKDANAFRHVNERVAQEQKKHRIDFVKAEARSSKYRKLNPLKAAQDEVDKSALFYSSRATREAYMVARSSPTSVAEKGPKTDSTHLNLAPQLPPSYYTLPLMVHDAKFALKGVNFSLAHPRERNAKPPVSVRKKVGGKPEVETDGLTTLETIWKKEIETIQTFYGAMALDLDRNTVYTPKTESEKRAIAMLRTVDENVQSLTAVAQAAKIEIMARFYKEKKLRRNMSIEMDSNCIGEQTEEDNESLSGLLSREFLDVLEEKSESTGLSEETQKEAAILAAQETALLNEAARIVNKQARKMAKARMATRDKVKTAST